MKSLLGDDEMDLEQPTEVSDVKLEEKPTDDNKVEKDDPSQDNKDEKDDPSQDDEDEKDDPFQEEKEMLVAQQELKKQIGEIPTPFDLKECCNDPREWHWTRWLWLVIFTTSLIFVILGSQEDNVALDYVFALFFIISGGLSTWLVWGYYTNWRIGRSIFDLWDVTQQIALELKRFEYINNKLTKQQRRLHKTKETLVIQKTEFSHLNTQLAGQVSDFKESQKLLQENLLQSRDYARKSLTTLRQERKVVEEMVGEQSKDTQEDTHFMLRTLFDHFAENRKLNEEGYSKLSKSLKTNITSIIDVVRIFNMDSSEIKVPDWKTIASNKNGKVLDAIIHRMFKTTMQSNFLDPLLTYGVKVKNEALKEEINSIRKAALILKELVDDFVGRALMRKKMYEKALGKKAKRDMEAKN
ncbi:hypothetical protein AAMO2058_001443700 [Amorphochlora amoebiformis]